MMIGFVGTGNMGHPMVSNLLKAGNDVIAFDQSPDALQPVIAAGGVAASSQKELVLGAEIVITMLPKGDDAKSTMRDHGGVISHRPGPR